MWCCGSRPRRRTTQPGGCSHPSQEHLRASRNGALIVRFRAGGVQEMCWHLFTWGTAVTVVAPVGAAVALAKMAKEIAQHYVVPVDGPA